MSALFPQLGNWCKRFRDVRYFPIWYTASMDKPTPEEIARTRARTGASMEASAELIGASHGAWKKWEGGERGMPAGLWMLYLLRIDAHQTLKLVAR